jgi:O-ureido-D-serine cyclo-ligase
VAPAGEFVVKPAISAGAMETARYRTEDGAAAARHVRRLHDRGQTVMVQPYQHAVDREGEIALVLINGAFSHAARKQPILRHGEGVSADPMNRLVLEPATPRPSELALAGAVARQLRRRFGRDPLYSRVDLVTGPTGDPLVLEVELIEPALFLPLAPGSADRLAAAVAASLP